MTAEWLHLPSPYPPGVGPLCGAELEAWYEDLQDILGSDGGGAKLARAPPCSEKEPEFLDVLESCSLTWLTDGVGVGVGGEVWDGGEGVQRVTIPEEPPTHPTHHTSSNTSPAEERAERQGDREGGRDEERGGSGGGGLLPPEFFELLNEGGVGMVETGGVGMVETGGIMVETGGVMVSGSHHHHHQLHHHSDNVQQPESPSASEEENTCVPDSPSCSSSASPSCSSSASPSTSLNCSPPSSPTSTSFSSSRQDKRKRGNSLSFPSSSSHSSSSSAKKSRREREQENERKVQELTDQNERLKAEIDRLGEEVQRTRRALIERLVNTRK